jgi:protocatechuate 3,4-dioxygenase beta subunit
LKAIILNSANKIEGELPGIDPVTLTKKGMARTIYNSDRPGKTWEDFADVIDVRSNNAQVNKTRQENALNPELGAGALDVRRAVTQINGGQNGRPLNVPANAPPNPIGWDGSSIKNAALWQFNDSNNGQILRRAYELPQLKPGSYFSATLNWERPVTMLDANGKATNGPYQAGFTFDAGAFSTKPPNLDLYLVKKGATTIDDAVWASTSKDNSVEHFFFQMPNSTDSYYSEDGYELWVVSREPQIEVPYGIAWWGVERFIAPAPREKLGGNAFNDTDGNGLRGPGEPTQAGVGVRLLDSSGSVIDSVKTDWQGNYEFDVLDGTYQVEFVRPRTTAFSQQDVGSDDTMDSDVNITTGRTTFVTVSGSSIDRIDAGLVAIPLGTVSGRAFNDANANGIQDAGETGYAGVRVSLHHANGEHADATDTDALGNYTFTNVAPDNYIIHYARPTNAILSPQDIGSDATDSDANPLTGLTDSFSLVSGGSIFRDVGVRNIFGSVTGVAYFDADEDGVRDTNEDGMSGQVVELRDSLGELIAVAHTEADGSYRFDEIAVGMYSVSFTPEVYWQNTTPTLVPVNVTAGAESTVNVGLKLTSSTAMITGLVWNDVNGNGLRETEDNVRAGVVVELRATNNPNVLATTTTGDDGSYTFSWIAPGTYDVRVVAPESGTLMNQGSDDTVDSDFDSLSLIASGITVGSWGLVEHLDAGLVPNLPAPPPPPPPPSPPTFATISGRAVDDNNENGLQDAGDTGISGATVYLLDLFGNTVAMAVTDANGNYSFTNVAPGSYRLRFTPPPPYTSATFAPKDVGANDTIDSDVDSLGYSDFFSLVPGQHAEYWDALFWGIGI